MFSASFRAYEFVVFIIGIGLILSLSLCLMISSYDLFSIYSSMEFLYVIYILFSCVVSRP